MDCTIVEKTTSDVEFHIANTHAEMNEYGRCVSHHVHELLQQVPGRLPQRDEHLIQVGVANPLLKHFLNGRSL